MTDRYIVVLDEGTTSTRAILYAPDGTVIATKGRELDQHYPEPGRVEHDAVQIWQRTLACARAVIERAGGADRIAAIGITNQRETVVAWDRRTGQPIHRAIVWQDRRTADFCETLRGAGHETEVQRRTGLLLDPYFSGTKMRWLLDNVPEARALGDNLALGTIESWLVWNLTSGGEGQGGGLHISDASNASRTLLFPLVGNGWDAGLADLIGVPLSALPEVTDTHGQFGYTHPDLFGAAIPICGLVGDQQSATIGQGCLSPGETKATFGTGAFILTNMGQNVPASSNRLLGTILHQSGGERHFALEGSVFVAGSLIQWLRDGLGLLQSSAESEQLARSVADNGGVTLVPALTGLGAPHWRPDARGSISGLTLGAGKAHIVRAALESMAHQCHDLMQAFAADGAGWDRLRIDGGMSANNWMAQDLADVLKLPVERPTDVETTALGAAMCAAVGVGLYPSLAEASACMRPETDGFAPAMADAARDVRLAAWRLALTKVMA
ncbi:glycerol kinase [Sphingomonas lacunae]|uniref:Glycerol kinase n=1 Tax=Sphingomonas lacunae TaxID=2698828 RepID=A0A6M4AW32_9SPHN|nr:glycerol kinase [Sphingomonas lacunae]QJQ31191.1 glycerol kinase [Sphingomonas lacunae]